MTQGHRNRATISHLPHHHARNTSHAMTIVAEIVVVTVVIVAAAVIAMTVAVVAGTEVIVAAAVTGVTEEIVAEAVAMTRVADMASHLSGLIIINGACQQLRQ